MQTRCPHCQTLFEIQEEQLLAASGQARCSCCDNIFNARKHLTQGQPDKSAERDTPQPQRSGEAISLTALFDNTDLEQRGLPKLYTGAPPPDFNDIDQHDPTADKPVRTEQNEGAPSTQDKFSISAALQQRDIDNTLQKPVTPALIRKPVPQTHKQAANTGEPTAHLPISQSSLSKKIKPRAHTLLWSLAILSLLATALTQIAWFSRDRLNGYPELREFMEFVCKQTGCNLPPWHEPEQFSITSRSVRTHPESNNALQIKLVFSNSARFAQRYPQLQLRLYDTNEILSAQRIFSPDEYLAAPWVLPSLIKPGQSVEVDMAFEDPGIGITGFKIEFL